MEELNLGSTAFDCFYMWNSDGDGTEGQGRTYRIDCQVSGLVV